MRPASNSRTCWTISAALAGALVAHADGPPAQAQPPLSSVQSSSDLQGQAIPRPALAAPAVVPPAAPAPAGNAPAPPVPVAAPSQPTPAPPRGVQTGELQSLDGWQVGQVPIRDVALAPTLWRNSDAVVVGALMDKLSGPSPSPAATRLARAALLSGGHAPAGSEAAANEAARKRFAALGRFGAADELAAMSAASPAARADPGILMFAAQADLARGRTRDACQRVQDAQDESAFILSLRAFCVASAGQRAAVGVALDVARGAGVRDAWLFEALPLVAGGHGRLRARYDSSLDAAVSVAAKLAPGRAPFAKASLLALGAVARNGDAPALLRAEAAQTLSRADAIDAPTARDALSGAPKASRAAPWLATLLAKASAAKDTQAKAATIRLELARAPNYADFAAAARLLHDDILALPRDSSTVDAAWTLARAELAAGDVKDAAAWRDLFVQDTGQTVIGPQRAIDAAIVAAGGGGPAAAKTAIARRMQGVGPQVARDAALLGALGAPIPATAGALIAATPEAKAQRPADSAILADMVSASQRDAMGETAILASRALAPGAQTLDRASLVTIIQALRAVKLDNLARQVAVEAMIGAGLE